MRAVRVRARADLRRRFLSWLALAVLVGITGGSAIAVASAARRTDTAYTRFLATHAPSDVSITDSKDFLTKDVDLDQVAAMPEVERSTRASFVFFLGHTADGRALTTRDFIPIAGPRGALGITLDRWKLLDGRRFDPAKVDEAVLDYDGARNLGLEVGDSLTLRFIRRTVFDREIVPYVAGIPARVSGKGTVGRGRPAPVRRRADGHVPDRRHRHRPGDVPSDSRPTQPVPATHARVLRPVRARRRPLRCPLRRSRRRDRPRQLQGRRGATERRRSGVLRPDPGRPRGEREPHAASRRGRRCGCLPRSITVATVMIAVQALSRQAFVESVEHPVLRAVGMTSRERFAVGLVRTCLDRGGGDDRRGRGRRAAVAIVADRPRGRRRAVAGVRGERHRRGNRRARRAPRRARRRCGLDLALEPPCSPSFPHPRRPACRGPPVRSVRRSVPSP